MADNNNTYSMSDYQKIVFVNNLNESSELIKDNRYNFAVFFANSDISEISNLDNYNYPNKLINIWHQGQRINRFIGIDKFNNSINVSETESYVLKFDVNSGLLSLMKADALESISLVKVFWTPFDNNDTNYEITDSTSFTVDAADNLFTIRIQYTTTSNFNINQIINTLKTSLSLTCVSNNSNIQLVNATVGDINSYNNQAYIDYQYKILYETYNQNNWGVNGNNISYNINGGYNKTINNIKFYLNLNPTSIKIINPSTNREISSTININNISGTYNLTYNVEITPNGASTWMNPSYNPNHPIYLVVKTSDKNQISINEAGNSDIAYIQLNSGNNLFHLTSKNISANELVSANISVWLEYRGEEFHNNNRNNCTKSFTITLSGVTNEYLFYYGYLKPENGFDISNMIDYDKDEYGNHYANNTVIYDYNTGRGADLENQYRTFYVAIPRFDKDNVKLCYDVYNNAGEYNDASVYFDVISETTTINNTNYIVYASKQPGKFYGKIQVINR